ncbi:MAG TPA: hypothetical protein VK668_23345 [Mucilaginibacter sp.]|nr:hypothetical protein [Mucilaginibacter sp.]
MKAIIILSILFVLAACDSQTNSNHQLQVQVDSLQKKLNDAYKPGLGEFMLGIQLHHAKLWFAGTNKNWRLADFEIKEIGEALGDIKKYCTDRPEVKSIGLIDPSISNINTAIQQKDAQSFKTAFITLTNNCNNCHKTTQHEFNVVTIPTALPMVNQDFKPAK